jgi:cell division protein FtsQ
MNGKKIILKLVLIVAWTAAGGGMLTLLIAANKKQQVFLCREVLITIKGDGDQFFIDKNDILQQLTEAAKGNLVKKPVHKINLAALEHALEKGLWIRDAELYFDSRNVLHVMVTEREPIARVFTTNGLSFYIDSSGQQMPLLESETARVLVITNFTGAKKYNAKDSAMVRDVKNIANIISRNSFWKEQITQVDIKYDGSFEAIPLVGDHIIRFGSADQFEDKLNRLMLFYKQVSSRIGMDKYEVIDVQYKGQVIGIHKGETSFIDSVQLQKNIEELLSRSRQQMSGDSITLFPPVISADPVKRGSDSLNLKPLSNRDSLKTDTSQRAPKNINKGIAAPKPKAVLGQR